ncbi:glycosyltransferase [Salinigranum marinum]|uniref:glycosyltransferase family 4 protein n=1 Tax=Salinigranum marinum TaxID=1515595 RepID=UPI002989E046|nr:glycosyltransferase [Salinigranum marinum]
MGTRPIVGIGPLSPPITGPGLKNKYIKQGLENAGIPVTWVNTLNRSPATVVDLVRQYRTADRFLVSASTKVRFGTAPLLARRLSSPDVDGILLPAGGAFATELQDLPAWLRRRYLGWFCQFDCILPQSDELVDELSDLFEGGVCLSTLPNLRPVPDDPPNFEPFVGTERPLRIAYVGRIKETKGLHYLLDAVTQVNGSSDRVELDVFGHFLDGDDYKPRFLRQCESTPNASFRGKLDNEQVIPQLREYDVFAFPTYYPGEGFPGVLVEAFAAGCAILATDWNYNSELITDGTEGLLCQPESVTDLQDKIELLLDEPERVEQYRRNSWQKAQNYSVTSVTNELLSHLQADH